MKDNIRIYYNEQCVYITDNAQEMLQGEQMNNAWMIRNAREEDLKELFLKFVDSGFDHLIFEGAEPREIFNQFEEQFEFIQAGGGVVWNEHKELLMIERLGKWDLPKGKLDLGEELALCAVREVEEETGLDDISLSGIILSTYHIYQDDDVWVLKQTEWYEMQAPKQDLVPQAEEGIIQTKWVAKNDINSYLSNTYKNIEYLMEFV